MHSMRHRDGASYAAQKGNEIMLTKTSAYGSDSRLRVLRSEARGLLWTVRHYVGKARENDAYRARRCARALITLYREYPLNVTRALQGVRP